MLSQLYDHYGLVSSESIYCHNSRNTDGLVSSEGMCCHSYTGMDGLISSGGNQRSAVQGRSAGKHANVVASTRSRDVISRDRPS